MVNIKGKAELKVDSRVVDKIVVNSSEIAFKFRSHFSSTQKKITIIYFANNGIHEHLGSSTIKNYPLELMNFASTDILEDISSHFNMSTLLFDEENLPDKHLVEIFYGLKDKMYLPFQVRRPSTKDLFLNVFRLVPVTSQLLVPLEMLSGEYEDFIENALLSFIHNVIEPIKFNPKHSDLAFILRRLEDLAIIITTQIDNIKNRSFQFNRLVLPIVHFAKMKKQISESISIDHITNNSISYSFKHPINIEAEDLAYFLSNLIIE